jgi:hypothetical protein
MTLIPTKRIDSSQSELSKRGLVLVVYTERDEETV